MSQGVFCASTATRQVQMFLLKPVHGTKAHRDIRPILNLKSGFLQIPKLEPARSVNAVTRGIPDSGYPRCLSAWKSLPVCCTALQPILCSPRVHKVLGTSAGPAQNPGHSSHMLSKWPSSDRLVSQSVVGKYSLQLTTQLLQAFSWVLDLKKKTSLYLQ